MPPVKDRAYTILLEYEHAQTELIGKTVVLSDGKAGTIDGLFLDELHGLRVSVSGHSGKWPVSTIKLIQS
ncbi:PRC-barrel domain containing protein [Bradyrhizobium sp. USDA 10063]